MSEQVYHSEKNFVMQKNNSSNRKNVSITEKQEFVRDAGQSQSHHLRREMSRRWMARFTLELFVYIGCVAVIAILGYRYCESRIWYRTDPFYWLIHMLNENWTVVFGAVLLIGCIVIAYLNFYKIAHLTEQLTEAVESVYQDRERKIQLPRELKEEENQLNQIRIEAEASRQEAQQRKNDMLMCIAQENGYYVDGSGSSWELMSGGAEKIGLVSETVVFDETHILEYLNAGQPIICSVGAGDFTTTGHFIVLCGVDADGKIIVHDPNSRRNSEKTWDVERLMGQIKNLWGYRLA